MKCFSKTHTIEKCGRENCGATLAKLLHAHLQSNYMVSPGRQYTVLQVPSNKSLATVVQDSASDISPKAAQQLGAVEESDYKYIPAIYFTPDLYKINIYLTSSIITYHLIGLLILKCSKNRIFLELSSVVEKQLSVSSVNYVKTFINRPTILMEIFLRMSSIVEKLLSMSSVYYSKYIYICTNLFKTFILDYKKSITKEYCLIYNYFLKFFLGTYYFKFEEKMIKLTL